MNIIALNLTPFTDILVGYGIQLLEAAAPVFLAAFGIGGLYFAAKIMWKGLRMMADEEAAEAEEDDDPDGTPPDWVWDVWADGTASGEWAEYSSWCADQGIDPCVQANWDFYEEEVAE